MPRYDNSHDFVLFFLKAESKRLSFKKKKNSDQKKVLIKEFLV